MQIHKLVRELAQQETELRGAVFVAPCVPGGKVRARVAGLVQTFRPLPADFEGWGIFQPEGANTARLVEEAGLPIVTRYLELLAPMRFWLAYPLQGQSWLAYPVNESDMQQRAGFARPVPVHLVGDGLPFEVVVARRDGAAWWFEEVDRRADPVLPERLRESKRQAMDPDSLRIPGLTPEARVAYDLAAQQDRAFTELIRRRRIDERPRVCARRQFGGGEG